jgi:hypothetical protein
VHLRLERAGTSAATTAQTRTPGHKREEDARCCFLLHQLQHYHRAFVWCIMTPPRNAHVFASLPTYEDFKTYRNAFVWLHRHGYQQEQDGYEAALQTRLTESSRYRNQPLPIPVNLIDFTRAQLDSVASTVSERLQQLGAPHTPEDAWASLQRDRAGAQTARRRVSRPSTSASSVRQVDARSSPPSSSPSSSSALSSASSSATASSSSPVTSSSLFRTSPASPTNLSPVPMDAARAGQQDVVTALTGMRELQRELDTSRTRELQSQASNDAMTQSQQALHASQVLEGATCPSRRLRGSRSSMRRGRVSWRWSHPRRNCRRPC